MESSDGNEISNQYVTDEEEYLKDTWDRLGVGHDGLLSLEDLSKVCIAIGLEEDAIQEIRRLFGRLDSDQDGMINFQEFLLIFQSASSANTSQVYDDSLHQDTSNIGSESDISFQCSTELGLLCSVDPQQTGYVTVNTLMGILRSFGMKHSHRVLRDLCLPYRDGEKIRIQDLVAAIDEECKVSMKDEPISTKQAALVLMLNEVKTIRQTLEQVREERDQYRWSLKEENHKVELMTQELEEHNTQVQDSTEKTSNLEKQVRELQESLKRQKENAKDYQKEEHMKVLLRNKYLEEEELKLKNTVTSKNNEIRSLENDNMDLSDKLRETQFQLHLMEKELSDLRILEDKVAELECVSPRENEFKSLLHKVEVLTTENNFLKDNNDELLAQIDSLSSKTSTAKHEERSMDGSIIGDYVDSSPGFLGSHKRRGGTPCSDPEDQGGGERGTKSMRKSSDFAEKHLNFHFMDVSVCDESYDASLSIPAEKSFKKHDFSLEELAMSPMPFKRHLNNTEPHSLPISYITTKSNYKKCETCVSQNHILQNLEKVLRQIQGNLNKSLLDNKTSNLENIDECKEESNKSSSLENIIALTEDIFEKSVKSEEISLKTSQDEQCLLLHQLISKIIEKMKKKRYSLTPITVFSNDGGSPRSVITTIAEEDEEDCDQNSLRSIQPEIIKLEKEFTLYENDLIKERDLLEKQRAITEEKCSLLEDELRAVQADFSNSEDYWQMKMKEEQEYYEGERKLCDEKFAELVNKIEEYEKIAKVAPPTEIMIASSSSDSDRLSPIDESAVWEKQVTELETEVDSLQQQNGKLSQEITEMKDIYEQELSEAQLKNTQEVSDLLQENELLQGKLKSLQQQMQSVAEKLQKFEATERHQMESMCHEIDENEPMLSQVKSQKIERLEQNLKAHQKLTCDLLTMTNERHRSEIQAYQTMNESTQQAFTTALAKYKDQNKRSQRIDFLVADLYIENAQLMKALQITEQRQKEAEKLVREMQMEKVISNL